MRWWFDRNLHLDLMADRILTNVAGVMTMAKKGNGNGSGKKC